MRIRAEAFRVYQQGVVSVLRYYSARLDQFSAQEVLTTRLGTVT